MKCIDHNGHNISKLSLGTVQFGLDYGIANHDGRPAQNEVNAIIDYVYNNGINCFDTAQAYGNSEAVLGIALEDKKDVLIVSKLKSELFINNIKDNFETSLSNLKKDSIFCLLLHDSKLLYDWKKEYSLIVDNLIEEKKIESFGVSVYTNEDFELAIANEKIHMIQVPFNLFDQRAITQQWFEKARKNNKLLFIRSIFLQGLLLMSPDALPGHLRKAKKYLEQVQKISKKMNCSQNELCMSFVNSFSDTAVLLFGCETLKQAKENLENYGHLPEISKSLLDEIVNTFESVEEEVYNPTLWRENG